MAKKIKFESFVHRFLAEAEAVRRTSASVDDDAWTNFIGHLQFRYDHGNATVSWEGPNAGSASFILSDLDLYHRGDNEAYVEEQRHHNLLVLSDPIQRSNAAYFRQALAQVCSSAGLIIPFEPATNPTANADRLKSEESFHNDWAASEDLDAIDIRKANEACTSPEMRYIRAQLADLRGKRLLDVGCGLGEASVYFALEGAQVTAMDLSQGMLDATSHLATRNGVNVRTHKTAAEQTNLPQGELFDVIYAGNLLHHVDIEATIGLLKPYLAPDGTFVSWDPIAYNPVINVYRAMAKDVRTPDEHPLRWKDIRAFRSEFRDVRTRYFWLTTLAIFVLMALAQRRNPNKERFWKAVVNESDRWRPLYTPLSKLDSVLLACVPPLRLLCWNVVIVARRPV